MNKNQTSSQRPIVAQLSKAPREGRVKTRMQPVLTTSESVILHKWLTESAVREFCASTSWRFELWVDQSHDFFDQLRASHSLILRKQIDGDLGVRLRAIALEHQHAPLLLIGSDCPFVTAEQAETVFEHLRSDDVDGVMIPAEDGGYVALGIKHGAAELFEDVDWGSAEVAQQTLANAERAGLHILTLAALPDIDRPSDLSLLKDLSFEAEKWRYMDEEAADYASPSWFAYDEGEE